MRSNRIRLSSGRFKGVALAVPKGVRPTSARVREALLDAWHFRLGGARVLDLFAGSGAVGLEALGRGASWVLAVESDRRATESLRRVCEELGVTAVQIRRALLPKDLRRVVGEERFDFIFADPPYGFEDLSELIEGCSTALVPDGELVVEHSSRQAPPQEGGELERIEERKYGETVLSVYRRCAGR